jgi:phosphoglycolate phosphatase-like HAD superfamily hydrolase
MILLAVAAALLVGQADAARPKRKRDHRGRKGAMSEQTRMRFGGIRAVLFDLDGTLTNSEYLTARAQLKAFKEFGYDRITLPQLEKLFGTPFNERGNPPRPGRLQILKIDPQHHVALEARYRQIFEDSIHEIPKMPHAERLLKRLKAADVKVGVVTSRSVEEAVSHLEVLGWRDHVEVIVGRGTEGAGAKPEARPALVALAKLGVPPKDVAFVSCSRPAPRTSSPRWPRCRGFCVDQVTHEPNRKPPRCTPKQRARRSLLVMTPVPMC